MPEITVTHILLMVAAAIAGAVAGWILRGQRAAQEKAAIGSGWQSQIDAQRKEHERLVDQNKALMEQVSQLQASNKDARNRARELASAVQEAFERRDALQREIKDIRANLETAVTARDRLQSDIASRNAERNQLRERDEKIARLNRELEKWQQRLPPLIERFRQRNEDAQRLEAELGTAQRRIRELETAIEGGQTRIGPVSDPVELTDGRDASNDPEDEVDVEVSAAFAGDAGNDPASSETSGPDAEWEDLGADDGETINVADVAADPGQDLDGFDDFDDFDDEDEDEDEDDEEPSNDDDGEPPSPARLRDDLKRIKGVGPAIEKTLNELGIFRFQQIADMSEYDIDRVAKHLRGFRSRIYREDWIGQARELQAAAAVAD